mgnify:CR=1 FL=1
MARALSRTLLAVVVIVVVAAAALGAYAAYVASRPRAVTLTVVTYTGAPAQPLLDLAAQEFERLHPGVKVDVVAYPYGQYISNELTVLQAGGSQYDVVTYTTTTVGLIAPYLLPLNSSVINESDILPPDLLAAGIYRNPLTGESEWVGVPIQTDGIVLLYNKTLFDNATLQGEFYEEYGVNLTPSSWSSWTDVLYADQFFTSHHVTRYGLLLYTDIPDITDSFLIVFGPSYVSNSTLNCGNPAGVIGFGTAFMGCVPSWWGHPFPPPAVNSSAGVEALETLKELASYGPSPAQLQVSFNNELQLLATPGVTPGVFGYIGMLPSVANASYVKDIGIAPLPGGLIRIGLTYIGVSKYSAHKKLALEFLQLVASPRFQEQAFLRTLVFPSSVSAYRALISNSSVPAYMREWLSAVLEAADKPEAILAPYVPVLMTSTMKTQVATYIYNYVVGQTSDPAAALQQVAKAYVTALETYYSTASTSTTGG